jgi:hypothetical protein
MGRDREHFANSGIRRIRRQRRLCRQSNLPLDFAKNCAMLCAAS